MPHPTRPASLPDKRNPSTRSSAPASPGLPPARRIVPHHTRKRRKHPARQGTRAQKTEALVAAAMEVLTKGARPEDAAVKVGLDASGRTVREVVLSAREVFARHAKFYVEAHVIATQMAAEKGDAEPAQWALERIADSGERVFDPPKTHTSPASVVLGIQIGGIPAPAHQSIETSIVTADELPALEPAPPEEDMP